MTPVLPPGTQPDGLPSNLRPPSPDDEAAEPPRAPPPRRGRQRDGQITNPGSVSLYAQEFCAPALVPREVSSHEPGDRWARLVVDERCPGLTGACITPGLDRRRAAPTGCVRIAFMRGEEPDPVAEEGSRLQCARCPEHFGTDGSFAECSETQLGWAQRGVRVFEVAAADRRRWEQVGTAALATLRAADAPPADVKEAKLRLLDIVREVADALFYCRDLQPLLPDPPRDHPEASFHYGRVDLNKSMVWSGATAAQGTAMEIGDADGVFHVYPGAFEGPLPGGGYGFSVDTLVMELVHEMRHMATLNHGGGEPGQPQVVRDAEHRINEQLDYFAMFQHSYFRLLPPDVAKRLEAEFLVGRDAELACFATVWPVDAATHGYPPDTTATPARATTPGMGMMGLMGLGQGVTPGAGSVVSPLAPPPERPARCFDGAPLTADQRCYVGRWAASNLAMRSLMVRTLGITEHPQPWNTLAHWSLLLPFRSRAACKDDRYVGGAGKKTK